MKNMVAIKTRDIKYNFRDLCSRVIGGEVMIVSRPKNENVVIISEKQYTELEKARRNQEYLKKIDQGFAQITTGNLQYHDLIEAD